MVARNWRKKLASKAETTKLTIRVKCSCSSPFFFSFRGRKRRARHFVFYTLKDTRKLRTRKRCVRYVRLRNSSRIETLIIFIFHPFFFPIFSSPCLVIATNFEHASPILLSKESINSTWTWHVIDRWIRMSIIQR